MSDEGKLSPEIDDAIVRNFYAMAYKNGGTYIKATDFIDVMLHLADSAFETLDGIMNDSSYTERKKLLPVRVKLADISACLRNFHENDLTDMLVPKQEFRTIL